MHPFIWSHIKHRMHDVRYIHVDLFMFVFFVAELLTYLLTYSKTYPIYITQQVLVFYQMIV